MRHVRMLLPWDMTSVFQNDDSQFHLWVRTLPVRARSNAGIINPVAVNAATMMAITGAVCHGMILKSRQKPV